jgi:hypothetical protein
VCNYCIEKTSRVILKKKTASLILKRKKRRVSVVKKTSSVYSHGPSRPSYKRHESSDFVVYIHISTVYVQSCNLP